MTGPTVQLLGLHPANRQSDLFSVVALSALQLFNEVCLGRVSDLVSDQLSLVLGDGLSTLFKGLACVEAGEESVDFRSLISLSNPLVTRHVEPELTRTKFHLGV